MKKRILNMSAPGEVNSQVTTEFGFVVKNESDIQKMVDVAVLLDGTASMGAEIQAATETMVTNVKLLKNKYPNCVFRVAFVVYRDYDEPDEFAIFDFSEDVEAMVSALTKQIASGGGDIAENVAGGLAHILDLSWKGDICQVFWVADAPAHGQRYHVASISDSYRDGDRNGLDPEQLMQRLAKKNIGVSFFKMNTTTDKMIDVFDEAYQSARIPGNKANFIVADVSEQLSIAKTSHPTHYDVTGKVSMPLGLFTSPSSEAYSEQFIASVSSQLYE